MQLVNRPLIQTDGAEKSTEGDRVREHAHCNVTVVEVGRCVPVRVQNKLRYFAAPAVRQLGLVGKIVAPKLNAELLLFSVARCGPALVLYAVGSGQDVLAGDCKWKNDLGA